MTRGEDAIIVSENNYFRWLSFVNLAEHHQANNIVQSLMHKRLPHQLTLPHQYALLMPLLFFKPKNITEFGLGGANNIRFLTALSSEIKLRSIERNEAVIRCCQQFFLDNFQAWKQIELVHQDAKNWLAKEEGNAQEWLIYDIYQPIKFGELTINRQLTLIATQLTPEQTLSINIPLSTHAERQFIRNSLSNLLPEHQLIHINVPHYQNAIVHLVPEAMPLTPTNSGYLSHRQAYYFARYWSAFAQQ